MTYLGREGSDFPDYLVGIEYGNFEGRTRDQLYREIKRKPDLQRVFNDVLKNSAWVSQHQCLVIDAIHAIYPGALGDQKIAALCHQFNSNSATLKRTWDEVFTVISESLSRTQKGPLDPEINQEITESVKRAIENKQMILALSLLKNTDPRSLDFNVILRVINLLDTKSKTFFFIAFKNCSTQTKKMLFGCQEAQFGNPLTNSIKPVLTPDLELMEAILDSCSGDKEIKNILFQKGESPLDRAIYSSLEAIELLIDHCENDPMLLKNLIQKRQGSHSTLLHAIHVGDEEIIKKLIKAFTITEDLRWTLFDANDPNIWWRDNVIYVSLFPFLKTKITHLLLDAIENDSRLIKRLLQLTFPNNSPILLIALREFPLFLRLLNLCNGDIELKRALLDIDGKSGNTAFAEAKKLLNHSQILYLLILSLELGLSENAISKLETNSLNSLVKRINEDGTLVDTIPPEHLISVIPLLETSILMSFLQSKPLESHYPYIFLMTTTQKRELLKNYPEPIMQTIFQWDLEEWNRSLEAVAKREENIFTLSENHLDNLFQIDTLDLHIFEDLKKAFLRNETEPFKTEIENRFNPFSQTIDEAKKIRKRLLLSLTEAESEAPDQFKDCVLFGLMKDPYEVPTLSKEESARKWIDKNTLDSFAEVTEEGITGLRNPMTGRINLREDFEEDRILKHKIELWKEDWANPQRRPKRQKKDPQE